MIRLARPLLLLPLLFLALFYFWPLLAILEVGIAPGGALDLSRLQQVFSPWHLNTLVFTCVQALLSTLLTIALALPAAWVCVRWSFPGRALLLSLSTLAFVLPTVVVAAAFSALIGSRGLVNSVLQFAGPDAAPLRLEGTLGIILLAHVFYNFAVALRIITSYWANRSLELEDAARVLGARGWQLWWELRLPLLRPALLASAVLIFIFTFTSFGVIIILGELRFATLEVEIYLQAVNLFNLPVAAGLSLLQIILMFALMLVYTRLRRRLPARLRSAPARRPQGLRQWLAVAAVTGFMLVLLAAPLLALALRSLTGADGTFTTAWYTALSQNLRGSVLYVPPGHAVGNSLFFALCTTALALALGLLAASLLQQRGRRWLDPLFMLPLATSAVTLGFGFIIALDEPPLDLRASPLLIPIAHSLVALPFVVRSVLPSLDSIAPALRESARVLGASPWQVWRHIDLPLVSRGLMVGAIFAFTISMGEFGASLFIARPANATIPVVIYRLLGQPGTFNNGQAMAMSVILLLTCSLGFVIIERIQRAGSGAF